MPRTRWERFQAESNPKDLTALVESHRALVFSVCRRYLHDPHDVEDAAQETFLKLARHAQSIHGNLSSWLAATAHSTAIDLIRRRICERKGRQQLQAAFPSLPPHLEYHLLDQAIRDRLHDALLVLDDASRQLLVDRYFRKEPLRLIAGRQGASAATISRRSSQALAQLAAILHDMGVSSLDEWTLAEHLGDPLCEPGAGTIAGDGLRFAPDWRASTRDPYAPGCRAPNVRCLPGWNRPIRVGAFASYVSMCIPGMQGTSCPIEFQIQTLRLLAHPGFELVSIVDPGTTDRGPVESAIREYQMTAGLVDVNDLQGLLTLDVILLGINFGMEVQASRALVAAVRGGVGLLNEWWISSLKRSGFPDRVVQEDVRQLMLAASPIYAYHTKPCSKPMSATVLEAHALLPGLHQGLSLIAEGCGPLYQLTPGARVLIAKDHVVPPAEHKIPGLGPARLPAFVIGTLGAGRVAAVHIWRHARLIQHPAMSQDYLPNLLAWLAEPRRQSD